MAFYQVKTSFGVWSNGEVDRMPAPWRPEPMSLSRLQRCRETGDPEVGVLFKKK